MYGVWRYAGCGNINGVFYNGENGLRIIMMEGGVMIVMGRWWVAVGRYTGVYCMTELMDCYALYCSDYIPPRYNASMLKRC